MSHERRGRGVICRGLAASVDVRLLRSAGRQRGWDAHPTIHHSAPATHENSPLQRRRLGARHWALYEALKTLADVEVVAQSTTTAQSRTP